MHGEMFVNPEVNPLRRLEPSAIEQILARFDAEVLGRRPSI